MAFRRCIDKKFTRSKKICEQTLSTKLPPTAASFIRRLSKASIPLLTPWDLDREFFFPVVRLMETRAPYHPMQAHILREREEMMVYILTPRYACPPFPVKCNPLPHPPLIHTHVRINSSTKRRKPHTPNSSSLRSSFRAQCTPVIQPAAMPFVRSFFARYCNNHLSATCPAFKPKGYVM